MTKYSVLSAGFVSLVSLLVRADSDALSSAKVLKCRAQMMGISEKYVDQKEFFSKFKFEGQYRGRLYPAEFGNVTTINDHSLYLPGLIVGTSNGQIVSLRPNSEGRFVKPPIKANEKGKVVGLRIEKEQAPLNQESFYSVAMVAFSAFRRGASMMGVSAIPTLKTKKDILFQSTKTVGVFSRNGAITDISSGPALGAEWVDGKVFVITKNKASLYDPTTGQILKSISAEGVFSGGASHPTKPGTFLVRDGKDLVLFEDFQRVQSFEAPQLADADGFLWSSNGSFVMVAGPKSIGVFSYEPRKLNAVKELLTPWNILSAAFDVSEDQVALSGQSEGTILNLRTGKTTALVKPDTTNMQLFWDNQDNLLFSVGISQQEETPRWIVQVWNPESGRALPLKIAIPYEDGETPPSIVAMTGRLFDGTFQFGVVKQSGKIYQINQVLNVTADRKISLN